MARSDWAALLTDPAQEYKAHTELLRFGVEVYLPQLRKRFHTRTGQYVMRHYPLFPGYLLVRFGDAHHPSTRLARGICRQHPVLADDTGRPWRAPAKDVEIIRDLERSGRFDEIMHKGDSVTLAYGVLACIRSVLASDPEARTAELFTPLFGGTRATISSAKLVRAPNLTEHALQQ